MSLRTHRLERLRGRTGRVRRQRRAGEPAAASERPAVERASATDLAFLAMDTGPVPEQFGVALLLDRSDALDVESVRRLLADRIPAVPRLRQRLTATPLGCGGPIWVDDPEFHIAAHVRQVRCKAPGDEEALGATALSLVMAPLPRTAPLWSATLVTGLAGGRSALVVVLHHVLADGIGGLAVLANLVDPGRHAGSRAFPRAPPSRVGLAVDAWRARTGAVLHVARWFRMLRLSMAVGGGVHPPRAPDCSLVRPTGPRRRLAVVRADHGRLRAAAHLVGATTNDAVLVAVAGALGRVLRARGESLDRLVVTVPVAGRRAAPGPDKGSPDTGRPDTGRPELGNSGLGNMVSPLVVAVPTTGEVAERLTDVARQVRAGKVRATGPPPIALLGWLFRPLASLSAYHWYMNHQHRFHTLVSHLRGPGEPLRFAGSVVGSAVPIGVAEGGNQTVYFEVLSYAGVITVSAIVDPDHFPDLAALTAGLRAELDLLVAIAA